MTTECEFKKQYLWKDILQLNFFDIFLQCGHHEQNYVFLPTCPFGLINKGTAKESCL